MAIKKEIELESGIVAEYWKIISILQDYVQKATTIIFAGYVNEEMRAEGKSSIAVRTLNIELISDENLRGEAYTKSKELADSPFFGAEDN